MMSALATVWDVLDEDRRRNLLRLPALLLIAGLLEGIGVGLFLPLLQVMAAPESLESLPWVAGFYWDGAADAPTFVVLLSAAILVVFLLKNAFSLYLTYYQQNFVWTGRSVTAVMLFRYYLGAPYTFHLQHNSAILLRNITQTVQELFVSTVLPLVTLIAEGIVILVICILLISVDPHATILVTTILCATVGVNYLLVRRSLKRWGQTTQHTNKSTIQYVQQSLTSVREIKVMGREAYFADLFAKEMALNSACRLRYQVTSQLSKHMIEIAAVLIMSTTLILTVLANRPLTDAIPTLGLFAVAAFRLMPSFNRIAGQMQNLRFGSAALAALRSDLLEARNARSAALSGGETVEPLPFKNALQLDHVSFQYPAGRSEALSDISLTVRRGESIALVGASGAGKSTLAAILMGLLTPTSGQIRVDGELLTAERIRSWRRHLGFIPQEVAILDDTLRRNVAFGVPPAEIEQLRLERAIRGAALDHVVAGLPDGHESLLGERGVRLSGGQRQRIGIARALYLDADTLVLDEATSALDAETESEISRAIEGLHRATTLIVIAHRLSTVLQCDRIYFMENGRIVDSGTFENLKARNAAFRSMVDKMTLESVA